MTQETFTKLCEKGLSLHQKKENVVYDEGYWGDSGLYQSKCAEYDCYKKICDKLVDEYLKLESEKQSRFEEFLSDCSEAETLFRFDIYDASSQTFRDITTSYLFLSENERVQIGSLVKRFLLVKKGRLEIKIEDVSKSSPPEQGSAIRISNNFHTDLFSFLTTFAQALNEVGDSGTKARETCRIHAGLKSNLIEYEIPSNRIVQEYHRGEISCIPFSFEDDYYPANIFLYELPLCIAGDYLVMYVNDIRDYKSSMKSLKEFLVTSVKENRGTIGEDILKLVKMGKKKFKESEEYERKLREKKQEKEIKSRAKGESF